VKYGQVGGGAYVACLEEGFEILLGEVGGADGARLAGTRFGLMSAGMLCSFSVDEARKAQRVGVVFEQHL